MMVIWGAVWGAVLAVLMARHSDDWEWIVGALFGALAGWTLRKAVRNEMARLTAGVRAGSAAEPTPIQTSAGSDSTVAAPTPTPAAVSAAGASSPVGVAVANRSQIDDTVQSPVRDAEPSPRYAADVASVASLPVRPPTKSDPAAALIGRAKQWLLGGNTVARVGALVLFIGLAFLAKWAADNSLFPPELRLAGIGIAGIALLVQGSRIARRATTGGHSDDDMVRARNHYGYLLQGAGIAILYLTVFAAFKLYAMIPGIAAFVLMALVCALSTLLALLADKQTLAFVGFAGAFATPVLVSTGGGSHVALFSYYLLLNVAIGVVAWLRAWRALNLLGFFSTFGVATAWGSLKYQPENYASTQPFLIAFFVIYALVGLFYTLRHGNAAAAPAGQPGSARTLDGILIFGTPIVAFMLQTQLVARFEYGSAISAVVLSAIYVGLALFTRNRGRASTENATDDSLTGWLTTSYAAMALVFATLAVPLAVDGRLTAAIWAIEGAGVFWLSTRQNRPIGQTFGAGMQILAALAFLSAFEHQHRIGGIAFANAHFIGCVMLAIGSLVVSWWSHRATSGDPHAKAVTAPNDGQVATHSLQTALLPLANAMFFIVGFVWLLFGVGSEITSPSITLPDYARFGWFVVSFVALASIACTAWQRTGWLSARYPVAVVLPALLLAALINLVMNAETPAWFVALLWTVCLTLHLMMLRRVDALSPHRWWRAVHAGNVLLLVLVVTTLLEKAITAGQLRGTDWAAGILLVACTLLLLALCSRRVWRAPATGWPLDRFQHEYALVAAGGVASLTLIGSMIVACTAPGNSTPLPYVPILNPVDAVVGLAIAAVALWLKRVRASALAPAQSALRGAAPLAIWAAAAFIAVNTVWLRFAHHMRNIPWSFDALANSFFVQAGYSVLWTLLGVALMWVAHRRARRALWQVGAGLLALTVVKLLLVDLANSGGGERIVAFIGVGLLMVAVGYFAPLPPKVKTETDNRTEEAGDAA